MSVGRYAPSPSGDLHLGNLRTAVLAWLFAHAGGGELRLRIEDLDRVQPGAEQRQVIDLLNLGLTFAGEVVRQSERHEAYEAAIAQLTAQDLTYECFCTRREILEAPSAPHQPPGAYPGTCRDLDSAERDRRRADRPPALRLRAQTDRMTIVDLMHGVVTGGVDDVVLRRNDGVAAYNLAVVVDDAFSGVEQVVRGDDLLSSAPRQAHLATLLGLRVPVYGHVPLVVNAAGARLAKRDGAVTATELRERGLDPLALIAESIGAATPTLAGMLIEFDGLVLPREPWVFAPPS